LTKIQVLNPYKEVDSNSYLQNATAIIAEKTHKITQDKPSPSTRDRDVYPIPDAFRNKKSFYSILSTSFN
jgi:hypothetical protein